MLREPFVSSGRAFFGEDSGYARHGTYQRVVAGDVRDAYGPWGTYGTRIVAGGATRSAAEAPALEKSRRLPLVDATRFFCAALTIWVHTPANVTLIASLKYGRVAMEYFTLLAVFFMTRWVLRRPEASWKQYASERMQRLYFPFLAWTLIYYGLTFARHFIMEGRFTPLDPYFWFNGNLYHLWFMPFVIIISLGLYPVVRWANSQPRLLAPICIVLFSLGVMVSFVPTTALPYTRPLTTLWWVIHHWGTIPCLPWGIAMALLYNRLQHKIHSKRYTMAIGGVLLAAGLSLRFFTNDYVILESIGGLGLLIVTLTPLKAGRVLNFMAKCGPYTFGIYLSHIVFVHAMIFLNEYVFQVGKTWWYDLVVWFSALCMSLTAVALLARSEHTRWLIASDTPKPKPATQPKLRLVTEMATAA